MNQFYHIIHDLHLQNIGPFLLAGCVCIANESQSQLTQTFNHESVISMTNSPLMHRDVQTICDRNITIEFL